MAILVRGEAGRLAVLVADVAAPQPLAERMLVAGMADPLAAIGVGPGTGKQDRRPLGPAAADVALLADDCGLEFLVDGDECLPVHLVVLVAKVGGLVGIVDDAVEGQAQRVP